MPPGWPCSMRSTRSRATRRPVAGCGRTTPGGRRRLLAGGDSAWLGFDFGDLPLHRANQVGTRPDPRLPAVQTHAADVGPGAGACRSPSRRQPTQGQAQPAVSRERRGGRDISTTDEVADRTGATNSRIRRHVAAAASLSEDLDDRSRS